MRLQQSERCVGVDAIALHEDALGLFDDRAAAECALQVLELGEASQSDVDGGFDLRGLIVVQDDVGKHAPLCGFVDVARVFDIEKGNDRTRRLMDDCGDLFERVFAVEAQSDERNLGARASTERPDRTDFLVAPDDVVAQALEDRGDAIEADVSLVGDQQR